MRRVIAQVGHERLGEALHREFRRAVGGLRDAGHQRRPEAVGARRVDDMPFARALQHREEGAARIIDAEPADLEHAVPFGPVVEHEAAAAADAGIVEEKVDVIALVIACDLRGEACDLILLADVGDVAGDPHALRHAVRFAQRDRFGHAVGEQVAHGDAGALGNELAHQLAAHAGATAGDHRQLSAEILHRDALLVVVARRWVTQSRPSLGGGAGSRARIGSPGFSFVAMSGQLGSDFAAFGS